MVGNFLAFHAYLSHACTSDDSGATELLFRTDALTAGSYLMAIDLAVERLILIIQNVPTIDTIIYSCDADDSSLVGTNIFKDSIGKDVVDS